MREKSSSSLATFCGCQCTCLWKKSPHVIQWSKIKWILSLLRLNCSLECLKMATRFIYIKQYIDTRSLKTNVENVRILLRVWFIDFVQFFKDICTNTGYKKKLKKSKIVFYFHVVIFFIDFQFLLKKKSHHYLSWDIFINI